MSKNYLIQNERGFDLFDPFFDAFFPIEREVHRDSLMKVDVYESDHAYHLAVDLPAIKKEDVKLELENGYLTIHASNKKNTEEKDSKGKCIRRERYYGTFSRTFYVGEDVTNEDIEAKLENGVLNLDIAKVEPKAAEKKYINIK